MTILLPPPNQPPLAVWTELRVSRPQEIRSVPFAQATIIRIGSGEKHLWLAGQEYVAQAGEWLILAAGDCVDLQNKPLHGRYHAEVLCLASELIQQFCQQQATAYLPHYSSPCLRASAAMHDTWQHVKQGLSQDLPQPLLRHRCMELLLALALHGGGSAWWRSKPAGMVQYVQQLLMMQPEHTWTLTELGQRLHCSEATIRRQLLREGYAFRELLEQTRLGHALILLQTSQTAISDVALACGYASPSRFAVRFRQRFGLSPSELRQAL